MRSRFFCTVGLAALLFAVVGAEDCKDDASCKLWAEKNYCKSPIMSEAKKKATCPILCGFCKPPLNAGGQGQNGGGQVVVNPNAPKHPLFAESIDEQKQPCTSFYDYACGGYIQKNVPKNGESRSVFFDLSRRVMEKEMDAVFGNKSTKSKAVQAMRMFRDKCMNTQVLDKEKTKTLQAQIEELGKIPMFEQNWQLSPDGIVGGLHKLAKFTGQSFLFEMELSPKNRGPPRPIFSLANLVLKKPEMYTEAEYKEQMDALIDFIVEFMGLLGGDLKSASTYDQVSTAVMEAIDLEKKIAEVFVSESLNDERTLDTTFATTKKIADLKATAANFDWAVWLDQHPLLQDPEIKAYLAADPPIFIHTEEAFKKVLALVTAEGRITANYLGIRFVLQQIPYLDSRFADAAYRFASKLDNGISRSSRRQECFETIKSSFPLVVDYVFVDANLKKETQQAATELVDKLREGLATMLRAEKNWMDERNRAYAIQKLGNMKEIVGAVELARDPAKLDAEYTGLQFTKNDKYTQMAAQVKTAAAQRMYKGLVSVEVSDMGEQHADNVNPAYLYGMNQLFIPAAVLEQSFFNPKDPIALLYGSLGFVIGHEMSHGFDSQGANFDASGLKRKWWSAESEQKFNDQSQCVVSAYGDQTDPTTNKQLDGDRTLVENLADAGGIRAAFAAFTAASTGVAEVGVPGYPQLSKEQAFFLRYATVMCSNLEKPLAEQMADEDEHAPARFRVNTVLANFPEFAKAFKCEAGSPMAPAESCSAW
ncbi:Phosphate-regulating neutral endopeptidase [Aphelenchoides fujianensis]|nr:Phosphate-regulating neutral endopeptidase [Aphelenchoides fujianensis]